MKKTVAEQRKRELNNAVEKYNIEYNTAKHLMNRFYRLNANLDRLTYLENDSYTCNASSTKKLSVSCDKRIELLKNDLKPYGLTLDNFSHLITIVEIGTTKTAVEGFYYN